MMLRAPSDPLAGEGQPLKGAGCREDKDHTAALDNFRDSGGSYPSLSAYLLKCHRLNLAHITFRLIPR